MYLKAASEVKWVRGHFGKYNSLNRYKFTTEQDVNKYKRGEKIYTVACTQVSNKFGSYTVMKTPWALKIHYIPQMDANIVFQ